ncbi:MAG: hypothetical protein ACRENT_07475 [Thermodesulfobacteriota bacterium]
MRFLSSKIAVLIMLVTVFSQIGFGEEGYTPDPSQSQFASSLKGSVPGVESAEWKTHVDLWVQASDADPNKAKEIAAEVVAEGSKNLGQSTCVHVHTGDWKDLYKLCWTY